MPLRFERQGTEGLFVLGNVLPQDVPEGLGLLRTEIDGLVVADRNLVGAFAGSQPKHELKIPHADANLDTVGVRLAVVIRLGQIELRLLLRWTHNINRLPRRGEGALSAGM